MLESKVLLKLNTKISDNKKSKTVLCVIQWGKNIPVIEKRNYYLKNEEFRVGKLSGFNKDDMKLIKKNWSNISKLL